MHKFTFKNWSFLPRWVIGVVSIGWLSQPVALYALAQADDSAGATDEKSYVLTYIIVLFIIAIGVAVVARSGRRADKPKMIEKDLEYRLKKMSGRSNDR